MNIKKSKIVWKIINMSDFYDYKSTRHFWFLRTYWFYWFFKEFEWPFLCMFIYQKAFINLNVISWDGKLKQRIEEQTGTIGSTEWTDRKERGTLSWEFIVRGGSAKTTQSTSNQNGLDWEITTEPIKDKQEQWFYFRDDSTFWCK